MLCVPQKNSPFQANSPALRVFETFLVVAAVAVEEGGIRLDSTTDYSLEAVAAAVEVPFASAKT